jgi:hypothetical protein
MGVRLLDPIAAAIVGFMVARMGWVFGWDALQDLSDRALDAEATAGLRELLLGTPGVLDLHELRTRKTGDLALVDAHILVDPLISVSEGHYIAESARARLLDDPRVLDALIHVDPEDDMHVRSVADQPPRTDVGAKLRAALDAHGVQVAAVTLHYLSSGLDAEVTIDTGGDATRLDRVDLDAIRRSVGVHRLDVLQRVRETGDGAARDVARGANGRWRES